MVFRSAPGRVEIVQLSISGDQTRFLASETLFAGTG